MSECHKQRVTVLSSTQKNGSTPLLKSLAQNTTVHMNLPTAYQITSSDTTVIHSLLPAKHNEYTSLNQ